VSDERTTQELLDRLDRPRELRAPFDRALRDELFETPRTLDDDVVIDLEPTAIGSDAVRRPRPGRLLLAAALIALLALGTTLAVIQFGTDEGNLATRSGRETQELVAAACGRFNANAFDTATRPELLGTERKSLFADRQKAVPAVRDLDRALGELSVDLRAAGIIDPELERLLALARSRASAALGELEAGRAIGSPRSKIAEVSSDLVSVERRLIALGVSQCVAT